MQQIDLQKQGMNDLVEVQQAKNLLKPTQQSKCATPSLKYVTDDSPENKDPFLDDWNAVLSPENMLDVRLHQQENQNLNGKAKQENDEDQRNHVAPQVLLNFQREESNIDEFDSQIRQQERSCLEMPNPFQTESNHNLLQISKPDITDNQNQNSAICNPQQQYKVDKKKQDNRNIPGNIFKFAIKAYFNARNSKIVKEIHQSCKIRDSTKAVEQFSSKMNWSFSLIHIYEQMNQEVGDENVRAYKRAFRMFYRRLLRRKYLIYILKQRKIDSSNKIDYIRHANKMIYLPDIIPDKKNAKRLKNETDIWPGGETQNLNHELPKSSEFAIKSSLPIF